MGIAKRTEADDDVILQVVRKVRKAEDYVGHMEVEKHVWLKIVLEDHSTEVFVEYYMEAGHYVLLIKDPNAPDYVGLVGGY